MAAAKSDETAPSARCREALEAFLESAGRRLDESVEAQLLELAVLVAQWGARMNLSGYRDAESVMRGLVCDGLALWFAVEDHAEVEIGMQVVDLGSGAGFPGLPLALLKPKVSVTLVESRERRHHFQRAVRRQLHLDNVSARLGRIEDLAAIQSDVVIAQAVAQPEDALELGLPWARKGGVVLIPANRPDPGVGPHGELGEWGSVRYSTPAKDSDRWLWWGRKV